MIFSDFSKWKKWYIMLLRFGITITSLVTVQHTRTAEASLLQSRADSVCDTAWIIRCRILDPDLHRFLAYAL